MDRNRMHSHGDRYFRQLYLFSYKFCLCVSGLNVVFFVRDLSSGVDSESVLSFLCTGVTGWELSASVSHLSNLSTFLSCEEHPVKIIASDKKIKNNSIIIKPWFHDLIRFTPHLNKGLFFYSPYYLQEHFQVLSG